MSRAQGIPGHRVLAAPLLTAPRRPRLESDTPQTPRWAGSTGSSVAMGATSQVGLRTKERHHGKCSS